MLWQFILTCWAAALQLQSLFLSAVLNFPALLFVGLQSMPKIWNLYPAVTLAAPQICQWESQDFQQNLSRCVYPSFLRTQLPNSCKCHMLLKADRECKVLSLKQECCILHLSDSPKLLYQILSQDEGQSPNCYLEPEFLLGLEIFALVSM